MNIGLILIGQVTAVILGRFYYDQGGKSKWVVTVLQTTGFPILFVPFFLFPSSKESSTSFSVAVFFLIYVLMGALLAGSNMLASMGLQYLPASTFSLISATQLAFNAIFSFFINSQKFTVLIFNSVVVLLLSASLLAVNDDSDNPSGVTNGKYVVGFVATLTASALYALLLSVMQLTFQKVIKKETFSVVIELQMYAAFFATCVSIVGLFGSGEWRTLSQEMNGFGKGSLGYVMTLVLSAVSWQVCSVGTVGLIFLVSSLFSNVICTFTLAMTPLAAVVVFHDKMNGVKVIAMLMGFWGFCTYIYQNYLDDKERRKQANGNGTQT